MLGFKSTKLLLICLLLLFSACKEEIIHNLSEYDANKLITSLHYAGIDSEKERQPDGKWALKVAADSAVPALTHLDNLRFFKRSDSKKRAKSSMMSSREEQRFQFERSLSTTIEATLAALSGVLDARVHLNLPVSDPLFGQPINSKEKGTASVLLIAESAFPNTKEQIAALVSGASGIPEDKVSVLVSKPGSYVETQEELVIADASRNVRPVFIPEQESENLFTPLVPIREKADEMLNIPEPDVLKALSPQASLPIVQKNNFKLWTIILGGICFLGLAVKLFYKPKAAQIKDKPLNGKIKFRGVKPHDFTNAVRNTAQ